ncbi:MAG: hypothetical protein HQ522_10175, partial [Bacteroidetes bacterium]|nr:hypothetical protein [Bacteroidota bacterium]
MKKLYFLFVSALICSLWGHAQEQDTISIPSGQANAGLLETTINADKNEDGTRKDPNRVYKLEPGFHFQLSGINVNNPDGTIRIVGAKGGKKPVVIPISVNDAHYEKNNINGSLELKNLHLQGRDDQGSGWFALFELQGVNRKITVEDCLFEFAQHAWFFANDVTDGLVIEMRNNYFRDLFWDDQVWASRVFEAKVPIDTLIFENNTVTGSGMALLQQGALCDYAVINHNTFVNNHAYPFINDYYKEAYITNNLFYNCMLKGEDYNLKENAPDKIYYGIVGVDTVDASLKVPERIRIDENTIDPEYTDPANYKIYMADNIYHNDSVMNKYYNGEYNDIGDYPVSYYSWFGVAGPHEVNVPTPWMNDRTLALINDHGNIKAENNILDQNPELATEAISTADAEQLAIWLRIMYEVSAETRTPDMSGYYFGDNNPNTIPGIETEDGDGITKFSDLIEDFSIGSSFKSKSDGFSIGALHWTSEIDNFDSETSLNAIKEAYKKQEIVRDTISIPSGQANAGLLETTINADKNEDGTRKDPNRVYKLEP